MGFAAAPLLIGLGVLLTAGIIFVLYWVRPEPQPVVVPSNLIWRRVLDERRRREDFWRWLISLLIALLAGFAIVLAMARPIPEGTVRGGRVVVVMDTSPSMEAALPGGGTRWEQASEQVRRILGSGNETSEFLLLDTGGERGGRSFIGQREALEALDSLSPAYGREHRFPDVTDLLEPAPGGTAAQVILVGDGVFVSQIPEGVERISVFEPASNAGITAFDVRPLPTDPGRFEAFVEVVRHSGVEAGDGVVVLQIDGAGGASTRRTFRVDAGEPHGATVPLTGFVAGPVRAVIATSGEDALAADDVAHAYIPARNRLRVLLVGGPNPFWEAALRLDPRVSLSVAAPGEDALSSLDPASLDLVVIEGTPPGTMPAVPALYAGSEQAEWLPPRLGTGEGGAGQPTATVMLPVARGQAEHPLLKDLNIDDALARDVEAFDAAAFRSEANGPGSGTAGGWKLLLGDARLGLLAAREAPFRSLAFAFPIARSNLPLQADFPLLLSRVLSWLTDVEVRRVGLGQARVAMAAGAVFDAEGQEVSSRRLGSEISFDASEPSLYYAAGGGREIVVAASLLNRQVSHVNRSAWAGEPPAPLAAGASAASAFWPLLALFALLLIVAEWVAFHRHATV